MTDFILRAGALSLACVAALGCDSGEPPPLYLGHLSPSGSAWDGIELAVERVNGGERPHGHRLILQDGEVGTDPADFRSQAVRLAAVNEVFSVLGGGNPEQTEALATAASTRELPVISSAGDGGSSKNSYFFPVGLAASERGRVLADYARSELGTGSAVLLADPDGREAADAFRAVFGSIRTFPISSDHTKSIAEALPDVVAVAGSAEGAIAARQRSLDAGLPEETPWLFLGPAEEAPEGFLATTPFVVEDTSERSAAFVAAFREQYDREPDAAAALAYDSLMVFAQALARTEEPTADALVKQLDDGSPFEVLAGELTFTDKRSPRRPVFVVRIEDGRPRLEKSDKVTR